MRVYKDPAVSAAIIGEIPGGEEVQLLDQHGSFYMVAGLTLKGWVGRKNVVHAPSLCQLAQTGAAAPPAPLERRLDVPAEPSQGGRSEPRSKPVAAAAAAPLAPAEAAAEEEGRAVEATDWGPRLGASAMPAACPASDGRPSPPR